MYSRARTSSLSSSPPARSMPATARWSVTTTRAVVVTSGHDSFTSAVTNSSTALMRLHYTALEDVTFLPVTFWHTDCCAPLSCNTVTGYLLPSISTAPPQKNRRHQSNSVLTGRHGGSNWEREVSASLLSRLNTHSRDIPCLLTSATKRSNQLIFLALVRDISKATGFCEVLWVVTVTNLGELYRNVS